MSRGNHTSAARKARRAPTELCTRGFRFRECATGEIAVADSETGELVGIFHPVHFAYDGSFATACAGWLAERGTRRP